MYGKAVLMALAAGACSHAGPARAATVLCTPAANARAVAGLSAADACEIVRTRTQAGLRTGQGVTIELDLSRAGSAIARVWEMRDGAAYEYPEIAVDVMDRGLGRANLDQLADAIVAALSAGPQPN